MFKLSSELTFPWPVKVIEPNPEKPGELVEHTFTVMFAFIDPEVSKASASKRREITDRLSDAASKAVEIDQADLKVAHDAAEEIRKIQDELRDHDRDALFSVLRGFETDFMDGNGKPIPFNRKSFDMVYAHDRVRNGLVAAYAEAVSGDKARLGN
ncbi:hypothetical protein [Oryzifoliimicrobium ureilyticus]|uniref:hypothetical protein n=1 Tax=Oryzifoliimicrobium ureilyticus TaxID=3113724 RepID=UPI0030764360